MPTKGTYISGMGASRYCSIDGNGRGTHVWDLNLPLSAALKSELGQFDLVTDFGTGEHIFDQAQVWKTIHELTKLNGCIVFDRPTPGWEKHCYYNTNVCLYHDIATANQYDLLMLQVSPAHQGKLVHGAFRKRSSAPFQVPQQGRYHAILTPIMGKQGA